MQRSSVPQYIDDLDFISQSNIDWDKLKNSSVLVTGATGLIGTVLVDALMYRNEHDSLNTKVFALSRSATRLKEHFHLFLKNPLFIPVVGDVIDSIPLEEKVDYVINLAGNTHPALYASRPIETIESIVIGSRNIFNLANRLGVKRILNASSVEVYGENRGDVDRFAENYCGYINPNTLRAGYPEAKRLSEAYGRAYMSEKGIDVVPVRLGRVYGPLTLDSDTKSTTQFIRSAVIGEDIVLKSNGAQEYSYVYVADAVVAFLILLTRGAAGEAYNVASDEVRTFSQVASMLAEVSGVKVRYELPSDVEKRGFSVVTRALMDSSKMRDLGWSAVYDLNKGLGSTVNILRRL